MGLFSFLTVNKQNNNNSYLELGSTGLEKSYGVVNEEFLKELKNGKQYRVYREMSENDAVISGILYIIKTFISSMNYKIISSTDRDGIEDAKFINECLNDMSFTFNDFVDEILSMIENGFSLFEIVYKIRRGRNEQDGKYKSNYSDGKTGWRKFAFRSQETVYQWLFDDNGGINGFIQQDSINIQKTIPIEKCLLFRTSNKKNNPEGRSLLRGCYRSWYFKSKIENIEAIGIERDLVGIPIMYVPSTIMRSDATSEESVVYQNIKKIVSNIRNDQNTGVVLPSDTDDKGNKLYDIKLLSTGGTRTFDTDKIIKRYDQNMAISLCADFLLLGHGSVGSWALSTDKTEMFAISLKSLCDKIAAVINNYAIPKLFKINGIEREKLPKLEFDKLSKTDITKIAGAIQSLSASGMPIFPDPSLEKQVFSMLGLEKTDQDVL